nr:hypothetical protein [Tanacetum cinerariifolium]
MPKLEDITYSDDEDVVGAEADFNNLEFFYLSSGPTGLFDIDSLTRTMNYQPVTAGNQTNSSAGFQDKFDAKKVREEVDQQYVFFPVWSSGSTNPHNNDEDDAFDGKEHDLMQRSLNFEDCSDNSSNEVNAAGSIVPTIGQNSLNSINTFSAAGPSNTADITYSDDEDVVGAEADFNNLEFFYLSQSYSNNKNSQRSLCITNYWRNPKGYVKLSKIQVGLKLCRKSFTIQDAKSL